MKIIKQKKPYTPDCGDYLWLPDYICELKPSDFEKEVIPLSCLYCANPWKILEDMGVENIQELREKVLHDCPYDKNMQFYGLIPVMIFTDDVSKYRVGKFAEDNCSNDLMFDSDWTKSFSCKDIKNMGTEREEIVYGLPKGGIHKAQLGHPYTTYTLSSDGSGSIVEQKMEMDNGDFVGILIWEWYNK